VCGHRRHGAIEASSCAAWQRDNRLASHRAADARNPRTAGGAAELRRVRSGGDAEESHGHEVRSPAPRPESVPYARLAGDAALAPAALAWKVCSTWKFHTCYACFSSV